MSNKSSIVFRVIGALLFITLICAGGFMAFQAGHAQGFMQASAMEAAGTASQPLSEGQLPHYGYSLMYPPFFSHIGFSGIILMFFVLIFIGSIFRHFVFGYPYRGCYPYGPRFSRHHFWGYEPEGEVEAKKTQKAGEQTDQTAK